MKSSPTAVSLLLTNLRLLNYDNDSEESFPITPDVFTSLKNKGKAFEHIVYHLLRILNPEECALRLDGCWPIYEPVQSRELRNIVFKWLADLKKSGQLGGNILVRRTLLDDCSGDRYEELLLSLSTMVLRDQMERGNFKDANRKTFAYKQTSSLTPSLKALTALIFAHQSSLTRLLHSRRLSKSQWSSFSSFLDSEESKISTISENLSQSAADETLKVLPRGYEEEVLRKWRNNWLGDQRWLDILLGGDPEYMRDRFFELSFEKALTKHHHFKNGLVGMGDRDVSLQALEKQVQDQKSRLRELRQMREAALRFVPEFGPATSPRVVAEVETQARKNYLKVVFDQHERLHSGKLKIGNYMATESNEYTELVDSLLEDLTASGVPKRREVTGSSEYKFQAPPMEPPNKNKELGSKGKGLGKVDKPSESGYQISKSSGCNSKSDRVRPSSPSQEYDCSDNPLIKVTQQIGGYVPHSTTPSDASYQGGDDEGFSAFGESIIISEPPISHADPISLQPPPQVKSLGRDSEGFGDDELIAEQIVSKMVATDFSPEKPSPAKRTQPSPPYKSPSLDDIFNMDESSLGLSIYQSRGTRHQNEQPSFSYPREILFTPTRDPTTSPTRKEDLLLSSDYNSVFKSRPKIAVSPTLTPAGGPSGMLPNLSLMSGMNGTPEVVVSEGYMTGFTVEHASPLLVKKSDRKGKR